MSHVPGKMTKKFEHDPEAPVFNDVPVQPSLHMRKKRGGSPAPTANAPDGRMDNKPMAKGSDPD